MENNQTSSRSGSNNSRSDQLQQEKDQVINFVNLYLTEQEKELFFNLKHVGRIGAWWNKKIVIYAAKGKDGDKVRNPEVLGVLTVQECSLNFSRGMEVIGSFLDASGSETQFNIGHTPERLGNLELFMWVPHFSELHWVQEQTGSKESTKLKFALAFKVRSDWKWFNRNNVFAMDLKQFKDVFPAYANVML